jgi:hypothetical protein
MREHGETADYVKVHAAVANYRLHGGPKPNHFVACDSALYSLEDRVEDVQRTLSALQRSPAADAEGRERAERARDLVLAERDKGRQLDYGEALKRVA